MGRLLIEHGADPNEIHPEDGGNALHAAASMRYSRNSSAFVDMLMAAGADPRIRSRAGQTALQIAEEGIRRQPRDGAGEEPKEFSDVAELLRRALAESAPSG